MSAVRQLPRTAVHRDRRDRHRDRRSIAASAIFLRGGEDTYRLTAYFPRAIGLFERSTVRVLGVEVGRVAAVVPEGRPRARRDGRPARGVKIPADAIGDHRPDLADLRPVRAVLAGVARGPDARSRRRDPARARRRAGRAGRPPRHPEALPRGARTGHADRAGRPRTVHPERRQGARRTRAAARRDDRHALDAAGRARPQRLERRRCDRQPRPALRRARAARRRAADDEPRPRHRDELARATRRARWKPGRATSRRSSTSSAPSCARTRATSTPTCRSSPTSPRCCTARRTGVLANVIWLPVLSKGARGAFDTVEQAGARPRRDAGDQAVMNDREAEALKRREQEAPERGARRGRARRVVRVRRRATRRRSSPSSSTWATSSGARTSSSRTPSSGRSRRSTSSSGGPRRRARSTLRVEPRDEAHGGHDGRRPIDVAARREVRRPRAGPGRTAGRCADGGDDPDRAHEQGARARSRLRAARRPAAVRRARGPRAHHDRERRDPRGPGGDRRTCPRRHGEAPVVDPLAEGRARIRNRRPRGGVEDAARAHGHARARAGRQRRRPARSSRRSRTSWRTSSSSSTSSARRSRRSRARTSRTSTRR